MAFFLTHLLCVLFIVLCLFVCCDLLTCCLIHWLIDKLSYLLIHISNNRNTSNHNDDHLTTHYLILFYFYVCSFEQTQQVWPTGSTVRSLSVRTAHVHVHHPPIHLSIRFVLCDACACLLWLKLLTFKILVCYDLLMPLFALWSISIVDVNTCQLIM